MYSIEDPNQHDLFINMLRCIKGMDITDLHKSYITCHGDVYTALALYVVNVLHTLKKYQCMKDVE